MTITLLILYFNQSPSSIIDHSQFPHKLTSTTHIIHHLVKIVIRLFRLGIIMIR